MGQEEDQDNRNGDEKHLTCWGQIVETAEQLNMDLWLGSEIRLEVSPDGVITVTRC